jgi:hypothetical protein
VGKRLVESAPWPLVAALGAVTDAALLGAHVGGPILVAFAGVWAVGTCVLWRVQYVAKGLTPRLLVTIHEAWDEPQPSRDQWLIFMHVEIEDPDADPVGVKDWETRLQFKDGVYDGQKFQHPPNSPRCYFQIPGANQKRFEYSDFIEYAGQIGARSRITCFVPTLFTAPYRDFPDVVLGVRIKPVGGKWSPWYDFQPPQYPAARPNPWP